MNLLFIFIFFSLLTFLLTYICRTLAFKFNILDIPGERKIHEFPTPLLGGLAIYVSVISGLIFGPVGLTKVLGLVISSTIIFTVGIIDDIRDLSAEIRLAAQLIASFIVMIFGVSISFLPNDSYGRLGEIILTYIWIIGITNALNYLDGVDGLAAGITAICAGFFLVISYHTGQILVSFISIIIMAGCLGFLPHNFKRDKIFLGDGGSTFLGFSIACLAIMGDWAEYNVISLVTPVLILGIPIFDMVFTTIMRIKERKIKTVIEWFEYASTDHFHHRLMHLGMGPRGVVVFIYCINISLGIGALMVSNEKPLIGFLSILQGVIIFTLIAILTVLGKRQSIKVKD
ncbi:MAG: MraY family glycosyltransferase [bacterium]